MVCGLLCLVSGFSFSGSEEATPNVVGFNVSVHSKVLGEDRAVQIYLPDGYDKGDKTYPVLYILDGQRWFLHGVQVQNILSEYAYTPNFIVVGVRNQYPQRFAAFSSGAEKFRSFLEQDLFSYIEKNYRTSSERMLFAWEYGGGFAVETLALKPDLFNAYIVSSSFPIDEVKLNALDKMMAEKPALNKHLYFACGVGEGSVLEHAKNLSKLLSEKAPKDFKWRFSVLEHERQKSFGHRTSPFLALYEGLRFYFEGYDCLEVNSVADLEAAGGLDYVKKYYRERAARFGVQDEVDFEAMFNLVRLGLDEDHFPTFDLYINTFKDRLAEEASLYWSRSYARFYVKHGKPDKAFAYLQLLETRFSDNPLYHYALGQTHGARPDKLAAKASYQKAVELARASGNERLADFEAALAAVIEDGN